MKAIHAALLPAILFGTLAVALRVGAPAAADRAGLGAVADTRPAIANKLTATRSCDTVKIEFTAEPPHRMQLGSRRCALWYL
jgi:hypothetical protein